MPKTTPEKRKRRGKQNQEPEEKEPQMSEIEEQPSHDDTEEEYEEKTTKGRKKKKKDQDHTISHDDESDEEDEKPKKKTKPTPKKVITGKKTRTPSRTPKKKDDTPHPLVEQEDSNSLFAAIREDGVAINSIVNDWIQRYESDKYAAIAEIITLFLQASGCLVTFTKEDLIKENVDLSDVLDNFGSSFPKEIGDEYPIVSKHKDMKIFVQNYLEFLETLMGVVQNDILFDTTFLDLILTWLTTLSSSRLRAFRHTSCLTVFHLMNSIITIHASLKSQLAKLSNQNKKKKQDSVSGTITELNTKINILSERLDELFESVFANRFKDTTNHIRALCMVSLGEWISMDPDRYLEDNSLKYIGWTLYDKDAGVREVTLNTCHKLYSGDFQGQLTNFSKKFLDRFVEMTSDISLSVSIESIKLCILFFKNGDLNKTQIKEISELILDENQSVRTQAAKFIHARFKKITLANLVELIKEFKDIPDCAHTLVETLDLSLDIQELIDALDENEDVAMIQLINSYCKKNETTSHMIPILPTLIMKFTTKPLAMIEVLDLIPSLVPDQIVEHHLEKDFTDVIKLIKNFFWKSTDFQLMNLSCRAIHHFASSEFSLGHIAQNISDEMIREMMTKLDTATEKTIPLLRIRAFLTSRDYNDLKSIQTLISAKFDDPDDVSDQDVNICMEILMLHHLWNPKSDKFEFVTNCLNIGTQHAFYILCDLDLELDSSQTEQFVNLFETLVENEEDEDQVIKLVMAFGKAILFGGISDSAVSSILIHFVHPEKQVGNIIRSLFGKFREMNPNNVWEYEFNALVKLFEAKKDDGALLKSLGSKLSKGHFVGKDPKNIAMILRNAFQYVFDDVNARYEFFEGIKPFVSKLDKNDASDLAMMISQRMDLEKEMTEECRQELESVSSLFDKKRKKNTEKESDEVQETPKRKNVKRSLL